MSETMDYPGPKNNTPLMFDFDGTGPVPAHRHTNPDGARGGWVANTAFVAETAHVAERALVYGQAKILDNTRVTERAKVCGTAALSGHARAQGSSVVSGRALVSDYATVRSVAKVFGEAQVGGSALVGGEAHVGHRALVTASTDLLYGSSGEARWSAYWYLPDSSEKNQKRVWLAYAEKHGDLDDYWRAPEKTYLMSLVVSFVRRAFYPTSDLEYLAIAAQDTGETPP